MSAENLFFLLIFVALPLFEWIGRLLRTREAERRQREEGNVPADAPAPQPRPRRRPVRTTPRDEPAIVVQPAPRPVQPRPQTSKPEASRPALPAVAAPRPVAVAPRTPPPPAAVVTTRSSWRRLEQLGLGGRSALRRAVVARTILGPCKGCRPQNAGHHDA